MQKTIFVREAKPELDWAKNTEGGASSDMQKVHEGCAVSRWLSSGRPPTGICTACTRASRMGRKLASSSAAGMITGLLNHLLNVGFLG